jgi:hypothetical protein
MVGLKLSSSLQASSAVVSRHKAKSLIDPPSFAIKIEKMAGNPRKRDLFLLSLNLRMICKFIPEAQVRLKIGEKKSGIQDPNTTNDSRLHG